MQPQFYQKFFLSLLLLFCCYLAPCQLAGKKWAGLLNTPFDSEHIVARVIWDSIQDQPDDKRKRIISLLENDGAISNTAAGKVRLLILKAIYCRSNWVDYEGEDWKYWGNKALNAAALLEDDYLVQSCCNILGDAYLAKGSSDTALFYMLKSIELAEQLGYKKEILGANKIAVSNALYRTQNFTDCIRFCHTGIDIEKLYLPITVITDYNNLGLSYLRLNNPDSALLYFNKALSYCKKIKWPVWEGIISGNIGDALHAKGEDDKAVSYWKIDYDSCMHYDELKNAGLTLAYMSEYQFNQGQRQKAINQLYWSAAINNSDPDNLVRIDRIIAGCYRKMGWHDSADYFYKEHFRLADSINKTAGKNNYNAIQLKLAYERNAQEFKLIKQERQAEITRRNLLLVALAFLIVIGWLLYNRQRLKIKLVEQQKLTAEAEYASAQKQLQIFTQTLLEKNEQIDQLNNSLLQQTSATNDELIHQTLLTDYDWNRFKELFEKINPDFFTRLKNIAPGITQSEMRLAALIKLNLDNKQMASMQGISLSSLRGNKTRLRQKLNISAETDLEEMIKTL